MAVRMATPIPARINQVLQDFLPAELDLIDTEEGGEATPDVVNYHNGFRSIVDNYPAVEADVEGIDIVERIDIEMSSGRLGQDIHARVRCNVQQKQGESIDRMQDLAHRYASGITRVLLLRKTGLQTVANNVRYAELVSPDGRITSRDDIQGSGGLVRSVTVPILVRIRESL